MIDWNDVNLPGNMDKEAMLEEISNVAKVKAAQHCSSKHPAFFSYDDLYQEIFVKCVQALPKFKESKSYGNKYKLFFYRCADNLALDMKRKHLFYRSAPCKKCTKEKGELLSSEDKDQGRHLREDCPLAEKHQKLGKAKRDLGWSFGSFGMNWSEDSLDIDSDSNGNTDSSEPGYIDEEIQKVDLDDQMKARLGSKSYNAYRKLLMNNYETSRLNSSELKLLKDSVGRIYKRGDRYEK